MEAFHLAVLHGTPRLDVQQVDLAFSAHPSMRREVNSGPLSERTFCGRPRSSISLSKARALAACACADELPPILQHIAASRSATSV
jgi:hypothetical protein